MKKILDPKNLPYFGALVQGVLFSIAGDKFFPSSLGWLVGLGVGMVVNFSMALASSRYADVAEKRKPLARLTLIGMFLLSPTTITLSLFFPSTIFAGIAWSICVDLSIVLAGSIVGKSLIPAQAGSKPAKKKGKPAKAEPEPAPTEVKPAFPCSCGKVFGSQAALNAHQRKHKPAEIFEAMANKNKV